MPAEPAEFAAWLEAQARGPALLGPAAWIVQTFLQMQTRGLPCELVSAWPDSGVVLAHRDHLPDAWPQRADRFVVCCLADRAFPHACANLHILQNPYQSVRLGPSLYMPHWPQPGLQPRDASRGLLFENLAFFGEIENLAPELGSAGFASWCRQQGMRFSVPGREAWADYRSVDAVIAVRRFTTGWVAYDKPATKLFNAWLAGVVPIVGQEAAYAAEGRHGVNCIVVSDLAALKAHLSALRTDPGSARQMLAAGANAAYQRSHHAIAAHWSQVLNQLIRPAADRRRQLGFFVSGPASALSRLKAGLAWRGHLLTHRQPPPKLALANLESLDDDPSDRTAP